MSRESPAGTQAPPVDIAKIEAATLHLAPKRKRGRPANGFNKKEHDRLKSAERRARKKEGK